MELEENNQPANDDQSNAWETVKRISSHSRKIGTAKLNEDRGNFKKIKLKHRENNYAGKSDTGGVNIHSTGAPKPKEKADASEAAPGGVPGEEVKDPKKREQTDDRDEIKQEHYGQDWIKEQCIQDMFFNSKFLENPKFDGFTKMQEYYTMQCAVWLHAQSIRDAHDLCENNRLVLCAPLLVDSHFLLNSGRPEEKTSLGKHADFVDSGDLFARLAIATKWFSKEVYADTIYNFYKNSSQFKANIDAENAERTIRSLEKEIFAKLDFCNFNTIESLIEKTQNTASEKFWKQWINNKGMFECLQTTKSFFDEMGQVPVDKATELPTPIMANCEQPYKTNVDEETREYLECGTLIAPIRDLFNGTVFDEGNRPKFMCYIDMPGCPELIRGQYIFGVEDGDRDMDDNVLQMVLKNETKQICIRQKQYGTWVMESYDQAFKNLNSNTESNFPICELDAVEVTAHGWRLLPGAICFEHDMGAEDGRCSFQVTLDPIPNVIAVCYHWIKALYQLGEYKGIDDVLASIFCTVIWLQLHIKDSLYYYTTAGEAGDVQENYIPTKTLRPHIGIHQTYKDLKDFYVSPYMMGPFRDEVTFAAVKEWTEKNESENENENEYRNKKELSAFCTEIMRLATSIMYSAMAWHINNDVDEEVNVAKAAVLSYLFSSFENRTKHNKDVENVSFMYQQQSFANGFFPDVDRDKGHHNGTDLLCSAIQVAQNFFNMTWRERVYHGGELRKSYKTTTLKEYGVAAYICMPRTRGFYTEECKTEIAAVPLIQFTCFRRMVDGEECEECGIFENSHLGALIVPILKWIKTREHEGILADETAWRVSRERHDLIFTPGPRSKQSWDDFLGLFLYAWPTAEIGKRVRSLCKASFFCSLFFEVIKGVVLRGSTVNSEIDIRPTSVFGVDSIISNEARFANVQGAFAFLDSNLGNDLMGTLKEMPPFNIGSFRGGLEVDKGQTHEIALKRYIAQLLHNTHTESDPKEISKCVLEWAMRIRDEHACDAMEVYCRLRSKLFSTRNDSEFPDPDISVFSRICEMERNSIAQSREKFQEARVRMHETLEKMINEDKLGNKDIQAATDYLRTDANEVAKNIKTLWIECTAKLHLADIIGSGYMGQIAQVYEEVRSCGGSASPLNICYGRTPSQRHEHVQHYLDAKDACRCLPDARFIEDGSCHIYFAKDPYRPVLVQSAFDLATVRAQTQTMQNILAEAFLTQRASNESLLGYSNKTNRGMMVVHEARQKVLLSLMAQRRNVYACCFKYKGTNMPCWCIGIK